MWFRSVIFTLGYVPIIFAVSVAGVVCGPFLPLKHRFLFPRAAFYGTAFWLRVTCGIDYRIEGLENLPATPCVVAANHQSAWETYILQTLIVPLTTVLKRELLWIPFFGWALALTRPIAINRSQRVGASKAVIKTGHDRLKSGISVLIFPEGTRVRPGVNVPFKRSAAVLAHQAGVDVLPVVHNAGEHWPARTILKKPGTITLKIGPLIGTTGKSADEIHELYTDWITRERASLQASRV
ncbi:MAG: lysophospholipid acyltransferase family protein [Campylobacterales bacterium]